MATPKLSRCGSSLTRSGRTRIRGEAPHQLRMCHCQDILLQASSRSGSHLRFGNNVINHIQNRLEHIGNSYSPVVATMLGQKCANKNQDLITHICTCPRRQKNVSKFNKVFVMNCNGILAILLFRMFSICNTTVCGLGSPCAILAFSTQMAFTPAFIHALSGSGSHPRIGNNCTNHIKY